jgi:hypothetical protein
VVAVVVVVDMIPVKLGVVKGERSRSCRNDMGRTFMMRLGIH